MSAAASPIRFVLVGGFLGSGKTTTLLRLARMHTAAGRRVGVLTNDQAEGLVDTETFRSAGFPAEEVPHGCFCCRFDELIAAAGRLADGHRPDVLLAEPVGSCADLVATVIRPLRRLYPGRFAVAPYLALLDPDRALAVLGGRGGLSAKVAYLYSMQQHEADVIAVNKADTLDGPRLDELMNLAARNFPSAEILAVSARTGLGFDRLAAALEHDGGGRQPLDIDYDAYAEGEARLGWLDLTLELEAAGIDADPLLMALIAAIRDGLRAAGAEPAHVKLMLKTGNAVAVANLTAGDRPPELSRSSGATLTAGRLLANARVEGSPEALRERVEAAVGEVLAERGVKSRVVSVQALSPGRPVPVHRDAG
jgi:Ni2+-binding GTPase involved in maturation of urease and hydrogenase